MAHLHSIFSEDVSRKAKSSPTMAHSRGPPSTLAKLGSANRRQRLVASQHFFTGSFTMDMTVLHHASLGLIVKSPWNPHEIHTLHHVWCSQVANGSFIRYGHRVVPTPWTKLQNEAALWRGVDPRLHGDRNTQKVWKFYEVWLVGGLNPSEKYESQLGWWHSQYMGK